MGKIWYTNPSKSEVIGCQKPNDHAEPTKVERLTPNLIRFLGWSCYETHCISHNDKVIPYRTILTEA